MLLMYESFSDVGEIRVWFARVGSMLAPVVGRELGKTNPQATISIFAFLSMIAGVFTLWLPETRSLKMIESIEEAEALGKNF